MGAHGWPLLGQHSLIGCLLIGAAGEPLDPAPGASTNWRARRLIWLLVAPVVAGQASRWRRPFELSPWLGEPPIVCGRQAAGAPPAASGSSSAALVSRSGEATTRKLVDCVTVILLRSM